MKTKVHVVKHAQVGEKSVVLKHHTNASLLRCYVNHVTTNQSLGQSDFTRTGSLKTSHSAKQCGFATARRSYENTHFSGTKAQSDVIHCWIATFWIADGELRNI
jgi:hypothetical protein